MLHLYFLWTNLRSFIITSSLNPFTNPATSYVSTHPRFWSSGSIIYFHKSTGYTFDLYFQGQPCRRARFSRWCQSFSTVSNLISNVNSLPRVFFFIWALTDFISWNMYICIGSLIVHWRKSCQKNIATSNQAIDIIVRWHGNRWKAPDKSPPVKS